MGKMLTHDKIINNIVNNNLYVKNGDIEVLGIYQGMNKPIECRCNVHNIVWKSTPYRLLHGSGCKKCGNEALKNVRLLTHDMFVAKLHVIHPNINVIDAYINTATSIRFQCSNGHIWHAKPNNILQGKGCPFCSGRMAIVGETDIATLRPDIAKLIKNQSIIYELTPHSGKRVEFVCPDCGKTSIKRVIDVCRQGFSCNFCSDGISFAEKMCRSILFQLNVDNLDFEWNPEWLKPYRYDAFFTLNSHKYVVEMDGGLGHGKAIFGLNEADIIGANRDAIKDKLALQHNVDVIRIDCCYKCDNRFEYIKNNILNSKLNAILDLNKVNWERCCEDACTSFIITAAKLYNDGLTTGSIKNILKCSQPTIREWLKIATGAGLCSYDPKTPRKRNLDRTKLM